MGRLNFEKMLSMQSALNIDIFIAQIVVISACHCYILVTNPWVVESSVMYVSVECINV